MSNSDQVLQEIADKLSALSVTQILTLSKKLEEEWGVSAAVAAAGPSSGGDADAAQEQKTAFDVMLDSIDTSKKVAIIKEVRAVTSLGLKEAKDLCEGTLPVALVSGVSKDEAERIKGVMVGAGATVTIK
ncbi:50S ribosomal protein L7/L12 [Rickettsiales endosymbiont of Paramecium tredecaurelia]|uniref:50S ribosomal protein L7/L12 n=1 Tax=Candidatus Sarmatiella mevalonica TaxID=2770581 RepID=UPI001921C5E9|nr:50S ribosomal protein L7/L12 [Candidatus Sarmatiella mevalonica]MBL3284829.1 50S ribosomal protein L7/L12 [Candidatus Sarmatiella mevalonica]